MKGNRVKWIMQKIQILPPDLRNRIAAGEVIERPASVVKELSENSIDAGAKSISIDVLNGGGKLIRVSDDGSGMTREDLLLCFQPHATSKVRSMEDLFNITTMGFRGEALSSIASVSRLSITSAAGNADLGYSIYIEGGELRKEKETAHRGTTVEVRDLFFNTPARKKFLKSRRTETHHIIETVTETAMSHPGTGFYLTMDRAETMNIPPSSGLRERLLQIYGEEFLRGLIEIEGDFLRAIVSKEGNFRSTRSHQYILINGRPIRDPSLRHAVYRAYDTVLPKDRHPIFFLTLSIDPPSVDFNVHPSKREVRFSDKEGVYRMVYDAVRKSVTRSALEVSGYKSTEEAATGVPGVAARKAPYGSQNYGRPLTLHPESTGDGLIFEPVAEHAGDIRHIYLGDVFVAYSNGNGVTLLDHHAAHERILYERLKGGMKLNVTRLLFPQQITLPPRHYRIILNQLNSLGAMGIELEDFGEGTLLLRAVPDILSDADLPSIISDLAESLFDIRASSPVEEIRDVIAKRIACHSSVRGRTELAPDEIKALLKDLREAQDPEHCPHGRPTRIHLGIEELKRMFKRT